MKREKMELGNVGIGECFVYRDALFVVQPFDYYLNTYLNLCIASKTSEYDEGDTYELKESTEVEYLDTRQTFRNLI